VSSFKSWFGSPEAMNLVVADDFSGPRRLTVEEATALVRLRSKRRERQALLDGIGSESMPPWPAS